MSTDLDLPSVLSLAGAAVDRHVLAALHEAGFPELRPRHGYVVQRLLVAPRTATELAADLGVTQQAVSKVAGELLAAGYVRRLDDGGDARRRPLALSARGEAAVAAARAARADLERRIAAAAGEEATAAARVALAAAIEVLGLAGAVARRQVPLPDGN